MRSFLLVACLLMALSVQSFAAVTGTSGNIVFDIDDNGTGEAILDGTGLGIGTLTPDANLHVMGNAITTGTLVVGGNTNPGSDNLRIQGTISQGVQWVSAGTNNINSSIVLADTSSGNVDLYLPNSLSLGTPITIKRTNTSNDVILRDSSANIESAITTTLGAGSLSYFKVFKTNDEWVILDGNDSITDVTVATANLFLWWGLNESSGNVSMDSSANGRSGNLTNELNFSGNTTSGPMKTALAWTDSDATVLSEGHTLPTTGYTYALWSRYNLGSEDTLSIEPNIEGSAGFVWASGNALYHRSAYHEETSGNIISTQLNSTLSANTWYHIAVSWDGSALSLYLNGIYESGNTAVDWSSGSNLEITNPGVNTSNEFAADDLRFFNKAISASEIRALYNAGNP